MSAYDKLLETVTKLEGLTQEQKDAILTPAKELNVDRGKMGQDLLTLKADMEKAKAQNTDYQTFVAELAKVGVEAKNFKELAAKAGIIHSQEDAQKELRDILLETQKSKEELAKELRLFKQEKLLSPAIEKAVKNFKDSEGKPIELKPDFISQAKEEAFKGIKDDEDVLIVEDRINKALLKAKANQDDFMTRNGFTVANTGIHKVPEKTPAGSATGEVLELELKAKKIMEEGRGSSDSAAKAIMLMKSKTK